MFQPLRTGWEFARRLRTLYPDDWAAEGYIRLLGNSAAFQALHDDRSFEELQAIIAPDLLAFLKRREKYLLYQE
jgi:hypothetical protein